MELNDITGLILKKAFEIHTALGPGLLESAYLECLYYEIKESGLRVEKEKPVPLIYKEVSLDHGYRIDLLVERVVVVELKSVDAIVEIHIAQTLTYLRLGNYPLGLLLNFNVKSLKNGIKRIIN